MGCRRGSLSTQGDLIVLQRAEAPVRNGGGLIETNVERVYKDLCKRSPHLKGRTKWKSTEKFWTS